MAALPQNAGRNAEIIARRKAGEGPRSIARSMGVSASVVAGVLMRGGLTAEPKGRAGASPELRRAAIAFANKFGVNRAGSLFKVAPSSISVWRREAA